MAEAGIVWLIFGCFFALAVPMGSCALLYRSYYLKVLSRVLFFAIMGCLSVLFLVYVSIDKFSSVIQNKLKEMPDAVTVISHTSDIYTTWLLCGGIFLFFCFIFWLVLDVLVRSLHKSEHPSK